MLLIAVLAALVAAAPAGGQSEGTLRDRIGSGKARERSLASSAARLGQLERKVAREVAVLEGRLADAQTELDTADAQASPSTAGRLVEARKRVNRLRERLARGAREAQPGCCASATWATARTSSPSSCTPTASRSCSRR